jgi:hypothetical protein
MDKVTGNLIGVVIQNNDPEMRGRVKVFVPHVSSNLYANWNQENTDKIFNFVSNPELQKILDDLKSVLPWAEYAGPIFGGSATARYNASLKEAVISDTSYFQNNKPIEGYRPLNVYTNELSYPDAFSATGKVGNNMVNPYAYQYIPSNYSNLAKGMFSIPNVGSHVWVWFMNGDTNYPVYFASAYGAEDIKRIYTMSQKLGLKDDQATSLDYPATYENIKVENIQENSDAKTFRSKHVINTNKNSIEIIDTDGREQIKLTQHSGSFIDLNNESFIRFSSSNDQSMVLGDVFNTFWKNKNEFIGGNSDFIAQGDSYEKIGVLNSTSINKIFDLYKEIHKYKMLFDVRRTKSPLLDSSEVFSTNVTSPFQTREGSYAICPVCNALPYIQSFWRMSPMHFRMCLPIPLPFPGFYGLSVFIPGVAPFISINGRVGFIHGRYCPLCNRQTNYAYPPEHSEGFSPSTESGFWAIESQKQINDKLGDLYKSTSPEILDLQNSLGSGGDKISNIARNYVLTAGLVMNDLPSYRVDSKGKLKSTSLFLAPEKVFTVPEPSPHVEHVDVDSLPGGDIIITAGNKLKFLVGSNGINIKTFGPIEMYGTITNLTSEQMNILAKHELFIDGGEKLSLRARNISLNPFEHNPVLVDGGLHVSRNVLIAGGTFIEGELGVQHITAPEQWYKTEMGGCATILANTLYPIPPGVVPPHVHPIIIQLPDHVHYYKNIPLTLTKCKEEARDIMVQLGINDNKAIEAAEITYPQLGVNQAEMSDLSSQLESAGIDSSGIELVFDTINQSVDTSGLTDIFNSFSTNLSDVSNGINGIYSSIQNLVDNNLNSIGDAISNSLSDIGGT